MLLFCRHFFRSFRLKDYSTSSFDGTYLLCYYIYSFNVPISGIEIGNVFILPFFYSQFFILLASLLIGIFDFRIGVPLGLLRGITSFVSSYFLFFVGWVSLTSASQADFVSNDTSAIKEQTFFERILPLIMPILLFGVWSAFSRSNPILDAVGLNGRFFMKIWTISVALELLELAFLLRFMDLLVPHFFYALFSY